MLGGLGCRLGGSGSLTCEAGSRRRIEAVTAVSAVTAGDLIIRVRNWWAHIHIIKLPLETRARECIHWFQRGFLGGAHHVGPKAPAHQQVARCIRILPRGEEESALQSWDRPPPSLYIRLSKCRKQAPESLAWTSALLRRGHILFQSAASYFCFSLAPPSSVTLRIMRWVTAAPFPVEWRPLVPSQLGSRLH